MARAEPGDTGDLDSVAKLVSLSMTAPMPRIPGEEPPLVTPGGSDGLFPDPSTRPQPVVGELPAELDALMGAPEPDGRPATAPPAGGRRPSRAVVIAGAAVVAVAGLGTWALWPAPVNGTAGKPAEVPAAPPPSSSSSAPPALATLSAAPETPPAVSDEVSHTTVHTTEPRRAPSKATSAPASKTTSDDPLADYFNSAVNSYLQQWSDQQQPPRRHR